MATLPAMWAISKQAWPSALLFAGLWGLVFVVTVVPVHGRSATGWMAAAGACHRRRRACPVIVPFKASQGQLADEEALHDPRAAWVLAGCPDPRWEPPTVFEPRKVAVIQDHATQTWAVTASVVHPGIGMDDVAARDRYGQALAGLLDVAGRTEKIDEYLDYGPHRP